MRLRGGRTGVRARHLRGPGAHRADAARSTWRCSTASGSPCSAPTARASRTSCGCSPGTSVAHTGAWKLGARVVPGHFAQTHARPELEGRTLLDILWTRARPGPRRRRCRVLRRYELDRQAEQPFDRLSGGQQARFQILLLELAGTTALLLDEPTDNLDLECAEALQEGLEAYEGTVLRGHARPLVRPLLRPFPGLRLATAGVRETPEPVWDERRVERAR